MAADEEKAAIHAHVAEGPHPAAAGPADDEKRPMSAGRGGVKDEAEARSQQRRSSDEDGDPTEGPEIDETQSSLPFSKARCIALVASLTGASFLNTLSIQAVVIILPRIGADLGIPDSRLQWIVSAYALTFGCFLLLWGRIADLYGKRLIFIGGSAWVAATMAANPFLPNEIAFDLFRGLQGLGAAANVPTALGILGTTFPPGKAKNYAFSTYAAGAPLGSIFGNLIAGFVANYTSWKWVFGVLAILAALVALSGLLVIPPPPPHLRPPPRTSSASVGATSSSSPSKATVDWIGGFLVTTSLLALMFALTEGNVVGWGTYWIWILVAVSVVLMALFIYWQHYLERKTTRRPLMKLSMFSHKRFSAAMVIMALFFSSFNNFLVFATYFYQDYQALSTLETTFRFIPTGAMGVLVAAVVAQLLAKIPTYRLLLFGNFCVSLSSLLFAIPIPPDTSYFAYGFWAMCLSVLGADTTWPSLTLFTSKALPHEDQALGGALVNAVGQIGRAIGLAIATAVQTAVMARDRDVAVDVVGGVEPWDPPSLAGLRAGAWFSFGLALVSCLVVGVAFRSNEIVGKVGDPGPARSGGQEGIMNEEETDEEAARRR